MTYTIDRKVIEDIERSVQEERYTLFVTDAELIRRIGVPEKIARYVIKELDAKRSDWPRKDGLWGNRRYWPAVRAYLDRHGGLK